MTPSLWLVGAALVLLVMAVNKLSEIASELGRITEHARIIRQYDLPEIVRQLEAINSAVHDPSWKKYLD